ncbi:MAG: hypothetical protein ACYTGZ_08210 [Planctomycetota bacterium]
MRRSAWWSSLLLASAVACGSGGGGDDGTKEFIVVVHRQPQGGTAGVALEAIEIRAVDRDGNVVEDAGGRVTLTVASTGDLPTARVHGLSGTLSRPLVDGLARFTDVRLTGAASDYTLRASGGGTEVETNPFRIRHADAVRVAFLAAPRDVPVGTPMPPFQVGVVDAYGNLAKETSVEVIVDIGALEPFSRDVLLHASGWGDTGSLSDAAFEFIDCQAPFVLPPELDFPPGSVDALAFDEFDTGLVFGTTRDGSVFTYDIFFGGGVRVLGGGQTLSQRYKGLYVDADGRLFGLPLDGTAEYPIDTATGVDNVGSPFPISFGSQTILGFNGAATDPVTGNLYAAARLASDANGPPRLLVIDGVNDAISRGSFSHGCASLATKLDGSTGRLFAASPDDAPGGPRLYEVNVLTAGMTEVVLLGNGTAGEALTYVFPAPLDVTGADFSPAPTVDGIATFAGWKWSLTAQGVTLSASAASLQPDESEPFDILAPDTSATVSFTTAAQTWDEDIGTITLSRALPHDITVSINANGPLGTATPKSDSDLGGITTKVIQAGQTSGTVAFTIADDSEVEGDEVIDLRITGVALGTIGAQPNQTVTIRDND